MQILRDVFMIECVEVTEQVYFKQYTNWISPHLPFTYFIVVNYHKQIKFTAEINYR